MRYNIFLVEKIGTDKKFEEMERIIGQVVADTETTALQIARETIKEAQLGGKISAKETTNKGMMK